MDLSGSYFHRLLDLAQPLGKTVEVIPIAKPLDFFEERLEVDVTVASQTPGISKTESVLIQEAPKESVFLEPLSSPPLWEEVFEKPEPLERVPKAVPARPLRSARDGEEDSTSLISEVKKPPFYQIQEIAPSPLDGSMWKRREESPRETSPPQETPEASVETFFENIFGLSQSPPSQERDIFSSTESPVASLNPEADFQKWSENAPLVEKTMEVLDTVAPQAQVFTVEQKQTLQQFIQLAVQSIEKKNPPPPAEPSFLKAPSVSPGPLWRGWTGRSGFPGRIK